MNAEGTLSIRLSIARDRVADVEVVSTRPVRASSVLAGRAPDDAVRLASLLFPVCGMAQGVACARAIDAALGVDPDPRLEAARDVACLAEAAVSHVWQLAIAWPEAAGVATDTDAVRAARGALATTCTALFGSTRVAQTLSAEPNVEGARAAAADLVKLVDELASRESELTATVRRAERAQFGAADAPASPELDLALASSLLEADPDFAAHPSIEGTPRDVSALTRQRGHAEVRDAEREHGAGLLARLLARRLDARDDARKLEARMARFGRKNRVSSARGEAGVGVGRAETARGPLVYRVAATSATVSDVRVVAPTDWTFHPRGVVRSALVGAAATPTLARDAGWLVLALDPCVPWTIEVRDA